MDAKQIEDHAKATQILSRKKEHCASHTVLVVDTSGSMKEHDIPLHRDRQVAAFTMVALEYVAEQLFNETANNRDVVSLIEFNRTATVVLEREPVSWVLFNKLLDRRGLDENFKRRELDKTYDVICSDSNYIPALGKCRLWAFSGHVGFSHTLRLLLEAAEKLLGLDFHDDCALSLGASDDPYNPSDYLQAFS